MDRLNKSGDDRRVDNTVALMVFKGRI